MKLFRRIGRGLVEIRATLGTAVSGMIANRMRAFLSTLGVAIGVATLMAISALVTGLQQSFGEQIAQLGANTLYVTSRPWVIEGDWWKYRNRPPITIGDWEALKRESRLATAVAPVGFAQADVAYQGENVELAFIRGTTDEYLDTSTLKVNEGRFLSPLDVELDEPVVVIGSELRQQLFKGADALGQHILVAHQRFRVVGVLEQQGKMFGQSLDNLAVVPIGRFGRLFGTHRNLAIAVNAPADKPNATDDEIIEILRRKRSLSGEKENDFSINRQSELAKLFRERTATLFAVAIAVGLITLIVGGIGVMNIMLVAVTERTREIGVRRALGARRRTILLQFLTEAMMVTLLGGILGTIVGLGGAQLISMVTPLSANASPVVAVAGLFFSALVGLAFGTWPAWRAAQLDPIESLRYE